jgi:hypothetical protein
MRSTPHIATDVMLAWEKRPHIGDRFLSCGLEGANLNDWLRANQCPRAQLQKFAKMRPHGLSARSDDVPCQPIYTFRWHVTCNDKFVIRQNHLTKRFAFLAPLFEFFL